MMVLGLVSLVQTAFLPGYLLVRGLRLRSEPLEVVGLSFALSAAINFILVSALVYAGVYTRGVVLGVVVLEAVLLVVLLRRPPVAASPPRAGRAPRATASRVLFWAAVTLLVFALCEAAVRAGAVFAVGDALNSWNRWALEMAANGPPRLTVLYPQLVPANLSLSYAFLGGGSVWFFSKGWICLAFPALLASMLRLGRWTARPEPLVGLALTFALFYAVLTPRYIYEGISDVVLTLLAFESVHCLLRAASLREGSARRREILLGAALAVACACTKQGGLYLAAVYPFLAWVLLRSSRSQVRGRSEDGRLLLWTAVGMTVLTLAAYTPGLLEVWRFDQEGRVLRLYDAQVDLVHGDRDLADRLLHAWGILSSRLGLPALLAISAGVLASLASRSFVWVTLLVTLPYTLLWAVGWSYDQRNAALVLPFAALGAAYGCMLLLRPAIAAVQALSPRLRSRLGAAAAAALVLVALVAIGRAAPDEELERSHRKRLAESVGRPEVNRMLIEHFRENPGPGRVLTTYKSMQWIPQLSARLHGYHLTRFRRLDEVLGELGRPTVRYLLINPSKYSPGLKQYVRRGLRTGEFKQIGDERFLFLEKLRPPRPRVPPTSQPLPPNMTPTRRSQLAIEEALATLGEDGYDSVGDWLQAKRLAYLLPRPRSLAPLSWLTERIPRSVLGTLGLLQMALLPGFLLVYWLRLARDGLETLTLSFGLSAALNYLLVYACLVLRIYAWPVVAAVFVGEIALIVYLLARRRALSPRATAPAAPAAVHEPALRILLAVAIAVVAWVAVQQYGRFGDIFSVGDAVNSWNRWGMETAANHLPFRTRFYPQLVPANFSLSYVFLQADSPWLFARAWVGAFYLVLLASMFQLYRRDRRWEPLLGLVLCFGLFQFLMTSLMLYDGIADVAVATLGFLAIFRLQAAAATDDAAVRRRELALGALFAAACALTKQAGLLLLAVYPFVAWARLRPLGGRLGPRWTFLAGLALCAWALVIPWYAWEAFETAIGADASLGLAGGEWHGEREGLARFVEAFQLLQAKLGTWVPVALGVLLLFSLGSAEYRAVTSLVTIPYVVIWAYGFSYDHRNLTFALPLIAVGSAYGLGVLLRQLARPLAQRSAPVRRAAAVGAAALVLLGALWTLSAAWPASRLVAEQRQRLLHGAGVPRLNAKLLEQFQRSRRSGKVLTTYKTMRWIPQLAGRYHPYEVSRVTPLEDIRRELGRPEVRYILVSDRKLSPGLPEYIESALAAGELVQEFSEGPFALYRETGGEPPGRERREGGARAGAPGPA